MSVTDIWVSLYTPGKWRSGESLALQKVAKPAVLHQQLSIGLFVTSTLLLSH